MSTKDISRFLFQPRKHYVGMRMQQGRVLIDSDHNEGASHDDEDQRQTLLALVGPQATPDAGFAIGYVSSDGFGGTPQVVTTGVTVGVTQVNINASGTPVSVPNFYAMPGSMFVGGLRVQMEDPEHIAFQSDYLSLTENLLPPDISSSATVSHHFFFLHVWEQCVTAVEDEEILEHALGGPDTSVRVRRMRRVEYAEAFDGEDCHEAFVRAVNLIGEPAAELDPATGELKSFGRLRLGFLEGDSEDTCAPCHPDPSGRYLGAENQAIRILLTDESHFVWAYDNAAPLYRATVGGAGDPPAGLVVVTMLTLPKDEEHWPLQGRVVEVVPWSAILENGEKVAEEVGVFCRVSRSYDPATKTFELDTGDATTMAALADLVHAWDDDHPRLAELGNGSEPRPFYLRFWHQTASGTTGVTIPTSSTAALGSTGIVPQFPSPGRRGDFWIAALRPETPNRVVPFDLQDNPQGVPPHGPRHFYAPLMLIHSANNVVTGVEDCRKPLLPVTNSGCCTHTVGDGVHSVGQFTSIQAAIDALPPEGGEVCVRPGLYREEFSIHNRVDVVVSGCGSHTIIESPPIPVTDALVEVRNGKRFTVRSLTIRATGQKAIGVQSMESPRLLDLKVEAFVRFSSPPIPDEEPVVHISGNADVLVRSLDIFASRRTGLLLEFMGPLSVPDPSGAQSTHVRPVILSGVTIRGARDGAGPDGPLAIVRFGSGIDVWGLVRLEHWHLSAFGQTALQCEQVKLELTQSVILSKPFSATRPAGACLDLNRGQFMVRHSSFKLESDAGEISSSSEHAAIVLRQGDMIVENNEIRASSRAWGGIQIAGGIGPVTIRGNQIVGGAGHGITLGSVLWYRTGSDPSQATRREGAGRAHMNPASGQVTGNLRPGFTDPNDGFLYVPRVESGMRDLEIVDNTITDMGTNGISVLTLFGVPLGEPLMATKGACRIKNNLIRGNLTNASPDVPLAESLFPVGGSRFGALAGHSLPMRMLPFGGIVLGPSTLASPAPTGPFYLDVSGNTVDHNGNSIFGFPSTTHTLPVSGIVVTGGESIRIADNVVVGNGTMTQPTDLLQTGLRAGIAVLMAGAGEGTRDQIEAFFNDNVSRPPSTCSLQVSGNRVEQREGRALFAVGTGPMAIQDNFFSSLGFHGSISSPEAWAEISAIGDVVYVHNLGRPWEASGLPTTGGTTGLPANNSQIVSGAIVYLKDQALSYGWGNLFFVGLGGHTLFTDNQVVYDWTVKRVASEPLSYAAVALVSLDNMAVRSNQFAVRLNTQGLTLPTPPLPPGDGGFGGRPILSHVLVVGHMVDVSNNRVAEGLGDCEASIFSIGRIANISTHNFGTHCINAVTPTMQALDDSSNMSMIIPAATCAGLRGTLFGLVDDFLFLLNDRRT